MKTTLSKTSLPLIVSLFFCTHLFSQIPLAFTGTPGITGTAGSQGAKYTYPNAGTTGAITIEAVIEIMSITGGAILTDIDGTATGSDNAFQPAIAGSQTNGNCWSIEFRISFYNASNNSPLVLSSFRSSGIDIDGAASMREFNTFYYPSSYTLQDPTALTVTTTSGISRFLSPDMGYVGISTAQTDVAVTCTYNNRSFIDLSIGACCVSGDCNAPAGSARLHSINFFDAVPFSAAMTTLPVKLISFNGNKTPAGVFLSWASAEETGLSHYILQRSNDGISYNDMAAINAKGNTSSYSYTDSSQQQSAAILYRLKAMDNDGRYTFSRTLQIKNQLNGLTFLVVSPNPVVNDFTVTIQSDKTQKASFRLINNEGRCVRSFTRHIARGVNLFPVEANTKLPKGIYFLQAISSAGNNSTIKVIVQ